jgi:glucosyl-3-phosphoglycerate synthase
MSNFHQGGAITTLHRLGPTNLDVLERDLEKTAATRPVALVLPCLASEFDTGAIPHIIEELQQVRYLEEIVVALGRASGERLAARANVAAVDRDNA